jgi:hypothetical protein
MDDNISGFFGPVAGYAQPDPGTFTLIHTSKEGFFSLYRGERAGRFRAYKCLKPKWRSSLLHETMLKKEFETGYPLSHPNICETCAFLDLPELGPCIEMEWVDGITLEDFLRKGRPDAKTFRKLAAQLCDALTYLHNRQILHRDLKPSNVMVTHDGNNLKLIDFGLADRSDSSVLKAPAGTRRFVAPEVLEGHPGDVRSDIYSLGRLLEEMGGIPRRVVRKCLQTNPERRYRSVAEVREALLPGRSFPWWGIAAAVLLIGLLIFLLWPHPAPETPAPIPSRDTVFIQTAPVVETPLPQTKQSSPQKREEEDPDRIFRAATELLEKAL